MVLSENQVRQLYVVNSKVTNISEDSPIGALQVNNGADGSMTFNHKGHGGVTRSDIIEQYGFVAGKATKADDMKKGLKRTKVVLGSTGVVAGQDYILNIHIPEYIGISSEYQYFKYGCVHTVSGMTASDFYKKMIKSLVDNFSREVTKMFKFYIETSGTSATAVGTLTEVTRATNMSTLTGTYTGIVIEEAPQDWVMGKMEQVPVYFNICIRDIRVGGDDVIWGEANDVTPATFILNGKTTADYEYFLHGERGDIYRGMGYPNNFDFKGITDPSREYHFIDITYFYAGKNEDVQKSQKTITLAVLKGNGASDSLTLVNSIITEINKNAVIKVTALT